MSYEVGKESDGSQWFAVWTRSRQEKSAAAMLETLGVSALPSAEIGNPPMERPEADYYGSPL